MLSRITGSLIVLGAIAFVLLLAGVGEALLTNDPPLQSRYESGPGGAQAPSTAPVAEAEGSARFAITGVGFGSAGYVEITNVGTAVGSFRASFASDPRTRR